MRIPVEIEGLAPGGEGVGHAGTRPVFVPWTAPGDRALAEVPAGDGPAHATLVELEAPGKGRVRPPCRHFGPPSGAGGDERDPRQSVAGGGERNLRQSAADGGERDPRQSAAGGGERDPRQSAAGGGEPVSPLSPHAVGGEAGRGGPDRACGGCEWLHVAYALQLATKERTLHEALRRIGRLEPGSYAAHPIVPSPSPLRYRARAKFHLDRASGRLAFFRRRSHAPVRLEECHLLAPGLDALREVVGPALVTARLLPAEVALEWSDHEGRGAAALRVQDLGAATRGRAEALLRAVPALSGVVLQAERTAPVTVGEPVLRHERIPGRPGAGLQRSRPDVFQQANRGANARMVEVALDLLRPEGEDVLELFCGAGNFTAALADRARSVSAVEVQGPALDLARAELGGRSVRFFAGDALALALAFSRETGPGARRFGAALLDPPREGARGVGPALRALGVPRAVYVSCDPATLARDLRACVEAGYRVATVVPIDMFPQTHHVEGVALLEQR